MEGSFNKNYSNDLLLSIFPVKADKSPKEKWQNVKPTHSLEQIIKGDLPKEWENIGVAVPEGFYVIDFDCPKDVDITFFKRKCIEFFKLA